MPQSQPTGRKPRIVWVDILRFLAIFMVICIHCSDPFNISSEARANPDYNFWGSLYGSFLRPCVPLFVMITGLLLLPVKMPIGKFYKRRLIRIAVPFVLWSVLYNLFPWIAGLLGMPAGALSDVFPYASPHASQTLADALRNIALIPVQFNAYTIPMWYLYMLIGLYLYMPFFSAWVERASRQQKQVFLSLWAVSLLLPYAHNFYSQDILGQCTWNTFGSLYYFAGFNGYLLLGHYITREVKPWCPRTTLLLCVPLFAIGYAATLIGFKHITADSHCTEQQMELFFMYCTPNVAMMTIAVFLVTRLAKPKSPVIISIFANLTKCGLGIYLCHYFVVGLGYALARIIAIPISIRIPATAAMVFAICWIFVATGYKLSPKVGKWIFG